MSLINTIIDNINSVVIGKEEVVKLILTAVLSEGHVLLEDVPGVGKTTFANAFAKTFDCRFSRVQFTPDTMPGDVIGSSVYNFDKHEFEYVPGAIMGNIILADEINRTSPKTQASMLEAMEERCVTVDGTSHRLPHPFMVIATQNPVTQKGTYYLPESQLDRFMLKLSIGYPDIEQSINIVKNNLAGKKAVSLESVADIKDWEDLIRLADSVNISDELILYTAECVECTRKHDKVLLGASPRALIAWVRAAKSYAYIDGRGYVTPDDIKYLAPYVLGHRLILKHGTTETYGEIERIIQEILGKVKVPLGR